MEGLSTGVKKEIANAENIEDVDWDAIDSDQLNSEDLDALEKKTKEPKKSGLDVKFAKGFGEDIGKKLMEQKKEKKERAKMSEFEKYQEKSKERKRLKKEKSKAKKEQKRRCPKCLRSKLRTWRTNGSSCRCLLVMLRTMMILTFKVMLTMLDSVRL